MQIVKDPEPFAVSHEQVNHLEALQNFGERIAIRRVWQLSDYIAGKTTRCTDCQAGTDSSVQARMAGLYKQAGETYCMTCYGIGFTGGYESDVLDEPVVYISYMIAVDTLSDWQRQESGEMKADRPRVQLSWTPHLDEGDLVARYNSWIDEETPGAETERLVMNEVDTVTIRTGLGQANSSILVAQETQLSNLPQQDPRYEVAVL